MSDPYLLALPEDFEYRGKTYKVVPRTWGQEAAFRKWLEQEALLGLHRHADTYTVYEYGLQLDGFRRDCAAGVFGFGEYFAQQAAFTAEGRRQLVFQSLLQGNDKRYGGARPTEKLVQTMYLEDRPAWDRLWEAYDRLSSPPKKGAPTEGEGEGAAGEAPPEPSRTSA